MVLKSQMPPDSITPKLLELALDAMEVVPGYLPSGTFVCGTVCKETMILWLVSDEN